MAHRGEDDFDLTTVLGRLEWALAEKGETKLSLGEGTGLDKSKFSRDMKRPSADVVERVTEYLGLRAPWWLRREGVPWQKGREPGPEHSRKKDKRTREGREGPATDVDAALDDYPFEKGLDYRGARALAASDLVRLHRWKATRVMVDINAGIERFHEPHGTTDRQIADGIVKTLLRTHAEAAGAAKVQLAPSRDPALKKPKRSAARPSDPRRR